jgi:hypothetical protein
MVVVDVVGATVVVDTGSMVVVDVVGSIGFTVVMV